MSSFLEKATLNGDKTKNKTLLDAKGQEIGGGGESSFCRKGRPEPPNGNLCLNALSNANRHEIFVLLKRAH